jgi:hypothetical protein
MNYREIMAFELMRRAADAGIALKLVHGQVVASGQNRPDADLLANLRNYKTEIIEVLSAANDAVANPAPMPRETWLVLGQAYQSHHWNCPTCIAASQGRGLRCGTGTVLWRAYSDPVKTLHFQKSAN